MSWLIKIGLRKWNFFGVEEFFFVYYDFKNGWKNKFDDNNKNHAADSKKGPPKIVLITDGTHESRPTAWKLIFSKYEILVESTTKQA